MYEWALFLHLVGAILFFAGIAVAAVGERAARGRARPSEVAALLGVARTGALMVAAGAVAAVGAGLWLIDVTPYGVEPWIVASLVLLGVAAIAGGRGGQAPKRARKRAEALAREGDVPDEELRALLDTPSSAALNAVASVAAVAILVLMVWKPG